MTYKRNNKRYNKSLSGKNNYFAEGGLNVTIGKPTEDPGLTVDLITPKKNFLGGLAGQAMDALKGGSVGVKGAVEALGNMAGSAIAGGLESGAGKAVNAVVGTVGKILPGPAGTIASAAAGVLGGLANRMFGSKLNKENIEATKNAIAGVNTTATASSLDTLTSNWGNTASLANFDKDYIGQDGWFANKAGKIYADLKRKTDIANARQDLALTTNYENIVGDTMGNLNSGYYAYGGPIGFGDGAIGYDFANRYLEAKELAAMGNDNPLTALPNMAGYGNNSFGKGGSIYIKPENRGKFTETKRRTGKSTEELTHSSNPVTRKRAVFALNSRHWNKHQDGGTLYDDEINPGLDAMVKARLALDSHFGNPTARRMTNYDTRSYTFPDGERGNVYVGSYDNYITPQIQDVDGELKFIEEPWSRENWERSEAQSMKFESPRDAEYFAKNYKRFAPMMSLYSEGGKLNSNSYQVGQVYDVDEATVKDLINRGYEIEYL